MELLIQKFKSLLEKFEKFNSIKFGKSCNKILKGGSGSGNFGHAGRIGEVGGSSGEGGGGDKNNKDSGLYQKYKLSGGDSKDAFIRSMSYPYDSIGEKIDSFMKYKPSIKDIDKIKNIYNPTKEQIGTGKVYGINVPTLEQVLSGKIKKGGQGSGNFNHAGRPGEVGGSDSDGNGGDNRSASSSGGKYKITLEQKPDRPELYSVKEYTSGNLISQTGYLGKDEATKLYESRIKDSAKIDGINFKEDTNNTSSSGVKDNLFDADNARSMVADRLDKEIKVPYIHTEVSTLGGKENASVLTQISLDKKEDWTGGILHNSRYSMFHLDRKGKLEQFSRGYTLKDKFRTTTVKSVDQAITKINEYIDKVK